MGLRRLVAALVVASGVLAPWLTRAAPPKPKVYRACPSTMVWSEPAGACVCAGALRWDPSAKRCTAACPPGKVQVPGAPPGTCDWLPRTCPPGKHWSEKHDGCVVVCPAGKAPNAAGTGCVADPHGCPEGTQWFDARSACLPFCAPGRSIDYANGTCVDDALVRASEPPMREPPSREPPAHDAAAAASDREPAKAASKSAEKKTAEKKTAEKKTAEKKTAEKPRRTPTPCPDGKEWLDAFDGCVPLCEPGEVLDFYGIGCHPIRSRR